jgi:hypothetical protein
VVVLRAVEREPEERAARVERVDAVRGLDAVLRDFDAVLRDFEAVVREPDDRDAVLRELAFVRERVARRPFERRSEAGISSVATAFVSCGSSFVRNDAMRSSCLRKSRASFSVSLSPTVLASVSIAT